MADADTKPQETRRNVWRVLGLILALLAAGILANVFRSDDLGISQNVLEAISHDMRYDVSALTTGHFAKITSLRLKDFERTLLTLPGPLVRWQRHVPMTSRTITDADLKGIDKLSALEKLFITETQVTDAGLVHLAKLPALQSLGLDGTQMTDAGLEHLAKLPALQYLYLAGTHVTDAGLVHLVKLPALNVIYAYHTQVTGARLERFKEERRTAGLPYCRVFR